jgi:hypothetical protein
MTITDNDLNKQFYQNPPDAYFRQRLVGIVAIIERREQMTAIFDDPATVGALTIHNSPDAPMTIPFNDDDMADRFALLESLVVVHHASEALLRLILAHRDNVSLPWLELSKLRNFKRFKSAVDKLRKLSEEDLTELVEAVIIGGASSDSNQHAAAVSAYRQIIRRAAHHVLDESNLYNAAKHGLALNAGRLSFTMTPESGDSTEVLHATTLAEGGTLEYLESRDSAGDRIWQLTTNMVDLPQLLTFAGVVCETIASLWSVARAMYLGDSSGRVWLPQSSLDEILPHRTVGSMVRFSQVLGVEQLGTTNNQP